MGDSIKGVATYAGISIVTASQTISTSERVSMSTLARVQVAMDALHYRPNVLGRQLRAGRTGLLGVVLSSLINPVFAECMQGTEEAMSTIGQHAMLMTTAYDREHETHIIKTMLERRVDGLILTVGDTAANSHLDRLDAEYVPYVLVYNGTVGQARIPIHCCATVDNRAAARDAIHALFAQGHRQIHMLTSTLITSDRTALRHNGYHGAPEAAGIAPQPPVETDFNADTTLPAELVRLLAPPYPTAIPCSNNRFTLLTIRSLREMGLRALENISVVGFDGLATGQWLSPTLAVAAQPHHRIGADAATMLARRITGEVVPLITLPHRLLAGGTLARVPAEASLSVISSLTSDTQGVFR